MAKSNTLWSRSEKLFAWLHLSIFSIIFLLGALHLLAVLRSVISQGELFQYNFRYYSIFLVGFLAAQLLPGKPSAFILELPPLRWPRFSNILNKTLARIEWYLREAAPLFVLGTLILFAADRVGLLAVVERVTGPALVAMLSLPDKITEVFIVGFLRRDFGAAGLLDLARAGELDGVQVVVALVTITLFIPCIANFFMMVKERGWKTSLLVAGFIFPFALLIGTGLNWTLRGLGVTL